MNQITKKDLEDAARTYINTRAILHPYAGQLGYYAFIEGAEMILEIQKQKPHVAEVVKCGWMNRVEEEQRKQFKDEITAHIEAAHKAINDKLLECLNQK